VSADYEKVCHGQNDDFAVSKRPQDAYGTGDLPGLMLLRQLAE